jgi:hypothetical protein|tara:strand:+ start:800 stop:1105 length:306 start_codon:yes stop_codon:yes gene_type:complete
MSEKKLNYFRVDFEMLNASSSKVIIATELNKDDFYKSFIGKTFRVDDNDETLQLANKARLMFDETDNQDFLVEYNFDCMKEVSKKEIVDENEENLILEHNK